MMNLKSILGGKGQHGLPEGRDTYASVVALSPAPTRRLRYDFEEIQQVEDLLGDVRGLFRNLVPAGYEASCVALDVGFASTLIFCTPEFMASHHHQTLRQTLESKTISLEKELRVSAEMIAMLTDRFESKASVIGRTNTAEETRYTELYEDLIRGAKELNVADLHIRVGKRKSLIRVRRYGRMQDWRRLDSSVLVQALGAGFNSLSKSGSNSAGSFSVDRAINTITEHEFDGTPIQARFSSYPTVNDGCKIVIRILDNGAAPTPDALGYSKQQIALLIQAIVEPQGLIIFAGSTNSGKSTTMRALMAVHPFLSEIVTIAVEDPSEYDYGEYVEQYSLQRNADDLDEDVMRKLMAAFRSILRQDPDIIIMGETRDLMTMNFAAGMVQTGHLLMTSMHGDGAIDVLSRMHFELNVSTSLLSARKFVRAFTYQKLLPRLCSCSEKVDAVSLLSSEHVHALRHRFKLDLSKVRCANAAGCELCNKPGLKSGGVAGLTLAAEVMELDEEGRALLRNGDFAGLRRLWRSKRTSSYADEDTTGKTAFEHAIYKISQGVVDPRDVEREFGPLATFDLDEGTQ
ncbi:hypothetical protein LMG19282_01469 [Cupriavidus campinensis]|uniref:Bacterial type II secretion system protein E domain-containing protein n=1 Tax=Cupriavidus campinensis TaxID=151783 RepID=A0ABY3EK27_9BURK|nr:ATPase, T2SS/T4P/T4SS family [Cupriavidus campinensis]TSP11003.1 hypothetical protein FGG12_19255 [Cupriavidus campinensis]CAG2138254.1 hypothetical protein LMG19282_01469 [Cupriavidus campinensis]